MTGRITVLRSTERRKLVKQFEQTAGGGVRPQSYDKGAMWFSVDSLPVTDIRGLHRLLQRLEGDRGACVIRGEAGADTNLSNTRRIKRENGGAFDETPRDWLMLDADGIPLPAGCSVLAEPAEAARVLLDILTMHLPELEGVTAVVQFSASAGLDELGEAAEAAGLPNIWRGVAKPGVSAHVWFCLTRPIGEAELKRWLAPAKAAGLKITDTIFTVQPHYTAAPIFAEPLQDPLAGRRTLLIEGEEDAAELRIPAEAERPRTGMGMGLGGMGRAGGGYAAFLDGIGGAEGFRAPMRQAIASFIGTNWPLCDFEALKAAIRARIDTADPGGRSAAELDRYKSDRHLDTLIAWTVAREEAKRAAQAAEAAKPIPPTYPDRGVPLAAARRQAGAAIESFAKRIKAGETPQLLLRKTVGGGKTFAAIDGLPVLLKAGRAVERGPVLFTHPRHALGDQIAADIRAQQPGLKVAVWRGMDADDPAHPGKAMCQDRELPRAARAAGLSATAGCAACPLRDGCSYHAQAAAGRGADVWVAPHAVLFMQPFGGWPRPEVDGKPVPVPPSVVIIDEDMTDAGLRGTNSLQPVQLALSALLTTDTADLDEADRENLLRRRKALHLSLANQPAGLLLREPVEWMRELPGIAGGTTSAARDLAKLEWRCKPKVKIAAGTTRGEALAAFAGAAEQRFTKLRPMLAERIGAFLATGDARSVNLTIVPEAELGRGQGTGPAVRFAWREDIHAAWAAPLLFLDATGRPEVLRHWAPALEVVDIEIRAPHQHVVQVADREFSRTFFTKNPNNVGRIADLVMVETAKAAGPVLVVAQKVVEALLRPRIEMRGGLRDPIPEGEEDGPATYRFPSGAVLHLAHHGAVTGSNAWQDVATVVVIGRPAVNRRDGERLAEVIAGRAVEVVGDEETWWPTEPAALRMADGTGHRIEKQPRHPDALVEAGRWAVTEGAALQAIGRGRGVRRTAADPLRVVVLDALALPLTVAEVLTWEAAAPDDLTVAAAEAALCLRALPLAAADLAVARDDLWWTEAAADKALTRASKDGQTLIRGTHKGLSVFKPQTPARYRKAGARRWSAALVPPGDGRAALEAIVGPLAAFELIPPPAAACEEPAMPPTKPPTEQEGLSPAAMGLRPLQPPLPGRPVFRPVEDSWMVRPRQGPARVLTGMVFRGGLPVIAIEDAVPVEVPRRTAQG